MKKQSIFPGIILIGIGLYFFLDQLQFTVLQPFYSWPTLLLIIGVAFLAQAYSNREYQNIIPGFILVGIGAHFHLITLFPQWPEHWAVYTIIIGIAFLLRFQQTKTGLVPALLLIVVSIIALFYHKLSGWLGWIGALVEIIETYWPAGLILAGIYLLFIKRK
ncbi:hypothetical protein FZW96_04695 [Bacillus sp. BGMRC 2118]|nr:hypothetical protein FZW96_04695 [Bacillus sp. BGMRC 2118]